LFQKRFESVRAQNKRPDARWKAATTRFSDFTDAERAAMRGYRRSMSSLRRSASVLDTTDTKTVKKQTRSLPDTVSWTHLRVAKNIQDQGGCGSCWAIATTSVLEAHYEIYSAKGGPTRSFSAQQVLECTPNPDACGGTGGCNGATVELGMAWVLEHGLATDDEVPYLGEDSRCSIGNAKASESKDDFKVLDQNAATSNAHGGAAFGLSSWVKLNSNEEYPLAEAVVHYGPVAVSAAASGWFEYSSGIFDSCDQDAVVDHAIVLYGFGVQDGVRYWLIRNSWGRDWGEYGYIRLRRHDDGEEHCGTDHNPSEGTGCRGGPSSVTVCGMCGVLYDSVVPHFAGSPLHNSSSFTQILKTEPYTDITSDALLREEEDRQSAVARIEADGVPTLFRREVRRHD